MHLYPLRRNVAAQVAEELKTVTYVCYSSYGGTQKKKVSHRAVKLCTPGSNPIRLCQLWDKGLCTFTCTPVHSVFTHSHSHVRGSSSLALKINYLSILSSHMHMHTM